ncbi:glycine--tRNA ligase subunit alpha/beta, partial [Saccharothrix sp. MB29]|nr:glycine--tRNA ligase subunit alpha/beta [Saccharothrix sp. MB29]
PELSAVTLTAGLSAAADRITAQGVAVGDGALTDAHEFVVRRYEQQLLDAGHEHRLVQAVLPLADTPAVADATLAELEKRVGDEDFAALTAVLQRARRIVPPGTPAEYDPAALVEPVEVALHEAVVAVGSRSSGRGRDLAGFTTVAAPLVTPVNDFFDGVMVMADDPSVRAARLGLLATVTALAEGVVDWKAL